jgi:hypothetical protein
MIESATAAPAPIVDFGALCVLNADTVAIVGMRGDTSFEVDSSFNFLCASAS